MKWISEANIYSKNNGDDKLGGGPSPCVPYKNCNNYTLCPNLCFPKFVCTSQHNCRVNK